MLQRWRSLTFLHWRYDQAIIRSLVPAQLTLDTFQGAAWVGVTPFLLYDLRLPRLAAVPWISRFPETNVRTYVRGPDGERGVWFFSLEADRAAAVLGARVSFHLPYRWADMQVNEGNTLVEYRSVRKSPFDPAESDIAIEPGEPISAGDFDNFLTARYRLYTVRNNQLGFAQIEHRPWPLQRARVLRLAQSLIQGSGVPAASGEPIAHYSADLQVRIGRLQWYE